MNPGSAERQLGILVVPGREGIWSEGGSDLWTAEACLRELKARNPGSAFQKRTSTRAGRSISSITSSRPGAAAAFARRGELQPRLDLVENRSGDHLVPEGPDPNADFSQVPGFLLQVDMDFLLIRAE